MTTRRAFVTSLAGAGAAFAAYRACHPRAQPTGMISNVETPIEDLMQEHAILERILGIYEHGTPAAIATAAGIIRRYIEDHHERDEERHVFPRLERVGVCVDLIATLRVQHAAGRRLTTQIIATQDPAAVAAFVRMYRPHAARENTVLFPAFRQALPAGEYDRLRETLDASERAEFGSELFETMRDQVARLEREVGIADLASFTPEAT
jgi:hemerythrin-like domain-containing protein